MNLRKKAGDTLDKVTDASMQTITTTQFATVALCTVSVISIIALFVAVAALNRTK